MLHLSLQPYQATNDILVNPSANKTKIVRKLVDDTEQVFAIKKTVGCQTRAKPIITKVTKRTKNSNFRKFLCL